jgi:hypothetical protein
LAVPFGVYSRDKETLRTARQGRAQRWRQCADGRSKSRWNAALPISTTLASVRAAVNAKIPQAIENINKSCEFLALLLFRTSFKLTLAASGMINVPV